MMEAQTESEWRESLSARLNEEMPRSHASAARRIHWLAEHLEEYIGRWMGYVEHPAVASSSTDELFTHGFYVVIRIGIELLQQEVGRGELPEPADALWVEVRQTYEEMTKNRDIQLRARLEASCMEFREALEQYVGATPRE